MNKELVFIIIIIVLAVNLLALWLTLGIKWLLVCNDWRSKKDYLRGIEESLTNYADRLDRTLLVNQKVLEALQNESKFRE